MAFTVVYGRHYGEYTQEFDTLKQAADWIETQEDMGEIWAASVSDGARLLFEFEEPPADRRWNKVADDAPDWPGKHP